VFWRRQESSIPTIAEWRADQPENRVHAVAEWRAYQVIGGCIALVSLLGDALDLVTLVDSSHSSPLMLLPMITFLLGLGLFAYGSLRIWWELR